MTRADWLLVLKSIPSAALVLLGLWAGIVLVLSVAP